MRNEGRMDNVGQGGKREEGKREERVEIK